MQFTTKFASFVAFATLAIASPAVIADTGASVVSNAELNNWLRTTDANLTFIGRAKESLARRNALDSTVVTCSRRIANVCGGDCVVYQGPTACLSRPGTACLMATSNVAYCTKGGCKGTCMTLRGCREVIESNFCATPGVQSVLVPDN